MLLIGALGVLWTIVRLVDSEARQRQAETLKAGLPLLILLLVSQSWVAIQWLGGLTVDVGETFRHLMLGLAYSLLFLVIISLFHTRKRLTLLLAVLVVSGTLQGFWGALMTLSGIEWLLVGPKDSYIGVATGTFVNRNHRPAIWRWHWRAALACCWRCGTASLSVGAISSNCCSAQRPACAWLW